MRGAQTISVPMEPTPEMLDAMAREKMRQLRANGHGQHGYRDLYLAALSAAPPDAALSKAGASE